MTDMNLNRRSFLRSSLAGAALAGSLGRFASADDIANTALFLASDWGNYITGQVISVCGGLNI